MSGLHAACSFLKRVSRACLAGQPTGGGVRTYGCMRAAGALHPACQPYFHRTPSIPGPWPPHPTRSALVCWAMSSAASGSANSGWQPSSASACCSAVTCQGVWDCVKWCQGASMHSAAPQTGPACGACVSAARASGSMLAHVAHVPPAGGIRSRNGMCLASMPASFHPRISPLMCIPSCSCGGPHLGDHVDTNRLGGDCPRLGGAAGASAVHGRTTAAATSTLIETQLRDLWIISVVRRSCDGVQSALVGWSLAGEALPHVYGDRGALGYPIA